MSKYFFRIIVLCFLIVSCSDKKEFLNEEYFAISEEEIVEENKMKMCEVLSSEMFHFIELLINDDYNVKTIGFKEEFSFKSYSNLTPNKTISFPIERLKGIDLKRKISYPSLNTDTYPRFSVYEICLDSPEEANVVFQDINEIINNDDIYNDKNYDYILINHNKLIYVSCNVKMFEEIVFNYKPKLEEIIQNSK